jgi:SAM-dependent methyltransferase
MESRMAGSSAANGVLWGASARDWATIQEGTCRRVYAATFDRLNLQRGAAYLDVGCGAGMAAQIAAERGAHVSGLDASEALLAIARERVPDGAFHLGEIEALPFDDASFDLVTGFNSFQYAANPVAGLSEAKRVAKPGAHVVVMTWGEPEGMEAASLVAALRPLLPPPPPGAPGPFALSKADALRGFAESAGLKPVEVFDVYSPWRYADLDTALRGLRSSGVAARAMAQSGLEAVNQAHAAALAPFRQADGRYEIGALFRCMITEA